MKKNEPVIVSLSSISGMRFKCVFRFVENPEHRFFTNILYPFAKRRVLKFLKVNIMNIIQVSYLSTTSSLKYIKYKFKPDGGGGGGEDIQIFIVHRA